MALLRLHDQLGRSIIMFLALILLLGIWGARTAAAENVDSLEQHEQWMDLKGRSYSDPAERTKRQNIFTDNALYVSKFNSQQNQTFKLKTNKFADFTAEEFRGAYTGGIFKTSAVSTLSESGEGPSFSHAAVTNVPPSMDWRAKGAVTPAKDQGVCGACWAFASASAVESVTKIKTGKLYELSKQQLIDCMTDYPATLGCKGGNQDEAFDYIVLNQGITTESNYPFKGKDGNGCSFKAGSQVVKISGRGNVPSNDEDLLLKAVSQQPVVSFIDSKAKEFQFYSSGVYNGKCGHDLDHVVLIVGYGTDEATGSKYWLIKNSWGTDWGENGYMRLLRNPAGHPEGLCGIAISPSYPVA